MPVLSVDVNTAKLWLDAGEAVLIDVREPDEHAVVRINGSRLLPLSQIETLPVPEPGTQKLVVHCRSGKRSATACQSWAEANPNLTVYNLEGGALGWIASGYPVED